MDISLEPKSKLRRFAPYIAAIALFIGACIWLAFSDIGKTLSVERRNLNIGEVQMGRFDDKYFADQDTQMLIFVVSYPDERICFCLRDAGAPMLITSARIEGKKANLALINDYGSEDLTATLTCKNDSIYILKQEEGSQLKVPKNGKWQKLPKTLEFKRR